MEHGHCPKHFTNIISINHHIYSVRCWVFFYANLMVRTLSCETGLALLLVCCSVFLVRNITLHIRLSSRFTQNQLPTLHTRPCVLSQTCHLVLHLHAFYTSFLCLNWPPHLNLLSSVFLFDGTGV